MVALLWAAGNFSGALAVMVGWPLSLIPMVLGLFIMRELFRRPVSA